MSNSMTNSRNCLITGGLGDIGLAVIRQLSPRCNKIFVLDLIHELDASKILDKLKLEGIKNIEYHQVDVADFDSCGEVIDNILKRFDSIDYVVNNAGITRDSIFTKMTKKQWDEVLSVNLDGMFSICRHCVPTMKDNKFGRIVNVSSVNAQKGQFSQANYAASKAGIYGFTKSLAQELMSSNITVNSISPGYVDTKLMKGIRPDILDTIIAQIPAKRLAKPQEVAHAIDFMLQDDSAYITGSNLSINGGLHMY